MISKKLILACIGSCIIGTSVSAFWGKKTHTKAQFTNNTTSTPVVVEDSYYSNISTDIPAGHCSTVYGHTGYFKWYEKKNSSYTRSYDFDMGCDIDIDRRKYCPRSPINKWEFITNGSQTECRAVAPFTLNDWYQKTPVAAELNKPTLSNMLLNNYARGMTFGLRKNRFPTFPVSYKPWLRGARIVGAATTVAVTAAVATTAPMVYGLYSLDKLKGG